MSDQRNHPANPWMRPMQSQQLIRNDQTRRPLEPAGPYTPNEPDHNEAIYAARAAAARQQAMARQAAAQPQSAVQQAVEQAARQAHAARQVVQPQMAQRYAYTPQPVQPAAVFYQQSTGVQQPPQPAPQQPLRPAQPHRLPMDAYAGQPVQQPAAGYAPSRQVDESLLSDAMLMEEARQPASPRRRRMVMRQEREAAEQAQRSQMPSAQMPPAVAAPMETIPAMPRLEIQPDAFFPPVEDPLPSAPHKESRPDAPTAQTLSQPADLFPQIESTPAAQPEPAPQPEPVPDPAPAAQEMFLPEAAREAESIPDPANPPADFFEMPLDNPLKQYPWYAEDVLEEDDDPEEDCMDTSSMPIPAPVSTLDIPKLRRGKRLLTVLLALMLLAAAGAFLWLSGYGEKLFHQATKLVETVKNTTQSTGPMKVSPESAGLPAVLTISITTDRNISDLRLIDDNDQELSAQIHSRTVGKEILWTGTLVVKQAYVGYLRTRLLCKDGQWRTGSEKCYVELN
ncbi:MAG: hypothetical protein E7323_01980 [Clostridiales bacterium]|nr:hypothetical protein [Clostridiales bacterium]